MTSTQQPVTGTPLTQDEQIIKEYGNGDGPAAAAR